MVAQDGLNFARRKTLPILKSSEAAECGLACIAMIARYHGHDVDLNALRQRFALSMSGATLKSLMAFADQLQMAPRALKVELEALPKLKLPAILHWDLNHFVVLKSISRTGAVVHDPASGIRHFTIAQLSEHFTGIALELTPTSQFEPLSTRSRIKLSSLWSKMDGLGAMVGQVMLLSIGLQIVAFAMPFQIQLVIDEAILRGDLELLLVLAVAFGSLIILQAVIEAMREWSIQIFGHLLSFQVVGNIVRHLMRLPSEYFEKRHVGDLVSRVSSANSIQEILTRGLVSALIDGAMAIGLVAILLIYSPLLTLVVLISVAANLLVAAIVFPRLRERQEEKIVESAREQSHIMESVRAATTIKVMGREAERESLWRNIYASVTNASFSVGKYQVSLLFFQTLIAGLQSVIVIYLGAREVIGGAGLSLGMLVAFLSFRQTFSDRANNLVNQFTEFRLIGLHLDRLGDIVSAKKEVPDDSFATLKVEGDIEVRNLEFRYGAADRLVLSGVSLDVKAGEFLAITGPSGGGKTTLIKLLLGLRLPTSGEIALDGHLATPELWRAWRESVGLVAQDDRLLSGTIADNISFFDPAIDMQGVQQAAVAAQVHDEILRMPMQYLSLIGDMGSALSGGQKQRILFARALYRKPKVLILDEGTANLDVATEEVIADIISNLPATRIVVAHRPALLRRADRVIVIRDGLAFDG